MFADVVLIVDTEEQDRDRGWWPRPGAGSGSVDQDEGRQHVIIGSRGDHACRSSYKYVVVRVAVKLSSGYVSGIGCFVCSNSTSEESE